MLNPKSPIPLYHQLADTLAAKIRSGQYPPGSRIPSEHSLAAAFGIGRPTVRQAIDQLVRKRIVRRKRGSGTFVREPEQEVDLLSLAGTSSSFHKKGISAHTRIIEETRLEKIGPAPDNPFSGGDAWFFSRLSLAEGIPVLIEDLYLHPDLFAGFDDIDMTDRSLSRVVGDRYFMRPTRGKQTFRIGYVSGKKAGHLGVSPDTPILVVKRFLHFAQAENAIYSELFCRTDPYVFSQEIGGISDD